MTDLYEQRENQRHKERERAALRWKWLVATSVPLFVLALIARWSVRACGHDLFGWDNDCRTCSLSETWSWISSGANWLFWAFSIGLVLGVGRALWTVRKEDEPESPK